LALPIVAFFLPGNWQLLAGILPPFWPLKVFWLAAQGQSYWPFLLASVLINLIALMLLLQCFQKVVHR
jgi:fluoroquinolone transport system permease protein